MKHNPLPTTRHTRSARRIQSVAITPRNQQRRPTLRPRSRNTWRSSIRNIIIRPIEAVRAEETEIRATHFHHAGSFNKRTVGVGAIEDLNRVIGRRETVGGHLLQYDGRGDVGRDSVVAVSAMADGVAVDFVDDVAGSSLGVLES